MANFCRTQHLIIEYYMDNIKDFDTVFKEVAPHLQTLDIQGSPRFDHNWDPFLDEFIAHRTPALQKLCLGLIPFPWGVHLANLKYIEVRYHVLGVRGMDEHLDGVPIRTFEHVLNTLRAARNLETLILRGDDLFEPPAQLPTPTISSRLRLLSLTGPMFRMGPLLAAIKAVPNLNIELKADERTDPTGDDDEENVEDEYTDSALASRILHNHLTSRGSGGPSEFTALHLAYRSSETIVLQLGFEVMPPPELVIKKGEIYEGQRASLSVRLSPPWYHCDATSIRAQSLKLARGVPDAQLGCIRHLTLSALCWAEDDVTSFLQRASLVESLTICSLVDAFALDAASLLVHVLCTSTAPSDKGPSTSGKALLLPALRSVHLIDMSFVTRVQCDGQDMMLDKAMTSALTIRQQSECGLEVLQLEDCVHVEESVLDIWAGLVPQVTMTSGRT